MSGRRREHAAHAPYPRTARVNELLREVIADSIERMADTDERLSLLTVTGVQTSADLSHAVVYLSSLDEAEVRALDGLRSELQHSVAGQVRMKRTPHLEFVADPAVAHGTKVEEILRRIGSSKEHGQDPEPRSPGETCGLLVVDKESGWTSHDVVAKVRAIFNQRRVGHAGTLDPDATGVLLVGVGRFTRMLRFLSAATKSYEAEVVLGVATSTLDASGEVLATWDMSAVTVLEAREAASALTGRIQQVPPMVSALKVKGRRLHELARSGVEVERAPRTVTVDRFEVQPAPEPGVLRIVVDCSSGTYVRTLAADLGERLGGGAHLRNLRRTRVGSFGLEEALRLDEVGPRCVLSPAAALRDMAQVEVDDETAKKVANGLPLLSSTFGVSGTGPWAILDRTGGLLAVYEGTDTDRVAAACVLGVHS